MCDFGNEFAHAIEAKQVAAKEAECAKFIVETAEQDKKSAFIRAQGSKTGTRYVSFTRFHLLILLTVSVVVTRGILSVFSMS